MANESESFEVKSNGTPSSTETQVKRNKVFVAIHSGAGNHSKTNEVHNKSLCKQACKQAMDLMIDKGATAIEALTEALATVEDDEKTNAGFGSNLNLNGEVECEACLMDGKLLHFGGVGALTGVRNPIRIASLLATEQARGPMSFGRVRPSFLVGKGAKSFCAANGFDTNYNMLSKASLKTFQRYKRKFTQVNSNEQPVKKRKIDRKTSESISAQNSMPHSEVCSHHAILDTVGGVCVDQEGNIAAASSTGGIWLKHPGRLGSVSMYGAGCWAQNEKSEDKPGVGVVTSGCGEQLMQTLLAKTCADGIRSPDNLSQSLLHVFQKDFLESDFLKSKTEKMGGVLALKVNDTPESREVEVGWIHSTNTFCIAFMGGDQNSPVGVMSRLDEKSTPGRSFTMSGHHVIL